MENTEKKVGMLQPLITYGLILSLGLIIHSIVNYVLDIYDPGILNKLLSWVIVGGLIFFGQYKYRNDYKGGYITYGQSLGFGVLMGVVAAVVSTLFFIVLIKVIDTGYMDRIMQTADVSTGNAGRTDSNGHWNCQKDDADNFAYRNSFY